MQGGRESNLSFVMILSTSKCQSNLFLRARLKLNLNKTGIMPECLATGHSSENHLNQKPLQKSSPWSPASGVHVRMRHERFKVTITTPLRQWKHTLYTFCSLRRWQWAVLRVSLPKMYRKGRVNRSNQSPSRLPPPPKKKNKKIKSRLHFRLGPPSAKAK